MWTESGGAVLGEAFVEPRQQYAAGSRQEKIWARQPLRPDWYDGGKSLKPVCRRRSPVPAACCVSLWPS